jgi:hypothetical protein
VAHSALVVRQLQITHHRPTRPGPGGRSDGAVWGSGSRHCAALDAASTRWTVIGPRELFELSHGLRHGVIDEWAASCHTLSRSADRRPANVGGVLAGATACLADVCEPTRTGVNETTTETSEDHPR